MEKTFKSIITKKGYGIFLNSIEDSELDKIKKELTVKPEVFADYDFGEDSSFPVYRLSDTRIYLPKFYGLKNYGPTEIKIKDGLEVNLEFNGDLKEHQIEFCNKVLTELKSTNSCIACSATGSGKTCCALWLASKIGKRTLIVVHKEFLMNQWIDRIKQFIPTASIGIIQQNKCEIDKDIIIGMIQTLTKREYPQGTFDSIAMMINDEVHHMACQGFSNLFYKVNPKITLGLSANVKRADGLTKVLEWFLGKIIKNEINSEVETPIIKFIEAEYSSNIVPKFNFKGNLNAPNMVNQLVADSSRNNQIINEIVKLAEEGRKILVLSGRRGHCEYLAQQLSVKKFNTGLYLGGMKQDDLEKSNMSNIIFATYSMASEAYDNPSLDTLVMSTGMGAVQQSIGRILRRKNKFRPLVVDFTDVEFFGGQARRRKQYYKKNGYEILKDKENKEILTNYTNINDDVCLC